MEDMANRAGTASSCGPGAARDIAERIPTGIPILKTAPPPPRSSRAEAIFFVSAECPPRRYSLVPSGPQALARIPGTGAGSILIGRNAAMCDIVVNDTSSRAASLNVSRVHAKLDVSSESELSIVDNNSVNGLFVNGVRVKQARIRVGDVVTLGCGPNVNFGARLQQGTSISPAVRLTLVAEVPANMPESVEEGKHGSLEGTEALADAADQPALHAPKHDPRSQAETTQTLPALPLPKLAGAALATANASTISVSAQQTAATDPFGGDTMAATALREHCSCSICRSFFTQPHTLACSHTFCGGCLRGWFDSQRPAGLQKKKWKMLVCPNCRHPVNRPPHPSRELAGLVETLLAAVERGSCAPTAEWRAMLVDRAEQAAEWSRSNAGESEDLFAPFFGEGELALSPDLEERQMAALAPRAASTVFDEHERNELSEMSADSDYEDVDSGTRGRRRRPSRRGTGVIRRPGREEQRGQRRRRSSESSRESVLAMSGSEGRLIPEETNMNEDGELPAATERRVRRRTRLATAEAAAEAKQRQITTYFQ